MTIVFVALFTFCNKDFPSCCQHFTGSYSHFEHSTYSFTRPYWLAWRASGEIMNSEANLLLLLLWVQHSYSHSEATPALTFFQWRLLIWQAGPWWDKELQSSQTESAADLSRQLSFERLTTHISFRAFLWPLIFKHIRRPYYWRRVVSLALIEHLGRDDPSFFTLWMEAAAAARGALRLPEAQGFPHTCAQYLQVRQRQRLA